MRTTCTVLFLITAILWNTAAARPNSEPDLGVTAAPDRQSYQPGDTAVVILTAAIPAGFHLYGNPLGPGIGKPLKLGVSPHPSIEWIGARKLPAARFQPELGDWVWAYEDTARFFVEGIISRTARESVASRLTIDALICHTSCIPIVKTAEFALSITSGPSPAPFSAAPLMKRTWHRAGSMPLASAIKDSDGNETAPDLSGLALAGPSSNQLIPDWNYHPREKGSGMNLVLAVILGFCAGIILNVMPCVLPVLGIRILSFSQGTGGSRSRTLIRSLVFSLGLISVFLVLAGFAAFAGLSWGQQFQNPVVLGAVVCVVFIFALGMFDVYTLIVPSSIGNLEYRTEKHGGLIGEFFKGVFTTILATPCSGPLLGAILAWALSQQPAVIFTVFAGVGLGMASPYVLLASSKTLMKMIPRPGKWMDDFKHIMGFVLFGLAVHYLGGMEKRMLVATIGLCVFAGAGVFFYGRIAPFGASMRRKAAAILIAVLIAAGGIAFHGPAFSAGSGAGSEAAAHWRRFSVEALESAHAEGRPVILDFTAEWCMNCKYNKTAVLHTRQIADMLEKKNVLALRADITTSNPVAESLLHHLGSRSIPFLAIFPGTEPNRPVIMRDILSKSKLKAALRALQVQ